MEAWFEGKKNDVLALVKKRKDCHPRGKHPEEQYSGLIFREDGKLRLTVDKLYEVGAQACERSRFYTGILCDMPEEYDRMTEEKLASKAYGIWCSGAR